MPDSTDRDRRELDVTLQLVSLLALTKGYAAPEVGDLLPRAQELSRALGQTDELVPVMFRVASFHLVMGATARAWEVAEQLLHPAERFRRPQDVITAGIAAGAIATCLGQFARTGVLLGTGFGAA